MRPRHASDYRTLLWAFVLFPLLPAIAYGFPAALPFIAPLGLYLSYCAGVLTHYHVHVPVFTGRRENRMYAAWLSIFYGCPIAFWIPTHLWNHHRYTNGSADVTRTDRRSTRHDPWQALMYSLSCAAWQWPLIARYVRRARSAGGRPWKELCEQVAALAAAHASMAVLAAVLHGPGFGAAIYALSFGVPALIAPTLMMFTNYIQHVGLEPSAHDHSRNFVSPLANWFVFDAGYHTVHHEHPDRHWSEYAALHRERAPAIRADLNQRSVFSFCLASYVGRGLLAGVTPYRVARKEARRAAAP